jgi:N-acetylated-alpha-linked acidic dipeptidase
MNLRTGRKAFAAGPLLAMVVLGVTASIPRTAPGDERRVPLGYTTRAFERERPAEQRFLSGVSPDFISREHASLTRQPHVAGSEGARAVAEQLRSELRRLGLETEIVEYQCFLSTARKVAVEVVAPARRVLDVSEPASPEDPSTGHPGLSSGYVAYSASGVVSGPVVYVNYGLPADYEQLARSGVTVRGRIVLARYARSHRAVKVFTAQEAGAVAIIIYSDPADDGEKRGKVWPDGPWRAAHLLQRGNAKYSWFWHGDPLTPGVAATADARRLDSTDVPTLPRIPAVVLSSGQAENLLRQLAGPEVPSDFQGGLAFPYHLGPGPATVRIAVDMDTRLAPIRDVIGRLRGSARPERSVILATHYDAWSFGAVDPQSANAALLEVARGLAELRRTGWTPQRTIVFAFWDGEEFGLLGSTEFAEQRQAELQQAAVCYINSDMNIEGRFAAGGVPSLRQFVVDLARDVADGGRSLYDSWREQWQREKRQAPPSSPSADPELAALGSGADFVAFQDFLGLPTLSLEFNFEGSYGTYHSNYDTRFYMERFGDPGFRRGVVIARLLGLAAMRLATVPVMPFRYSEYARRIDEFIQAAPQWAAGSGLTLDTEPLREQARAFMRASEELEQGLDQALAEGRVPGDASTLNDRLCRIEQALLDASEPPDRRWYRHVVYGWNIYSLYDGQPLPGVAEAIRVGEPTRVVRECRRLEQALTRAVRAVQEAYAAAGFGARQ